MSYRQMMFQDHFGATKFSIYFCVFTRSVAVVSVIYMFYNFDRRLVTRKVLNNYFIKRKVCFHYIHVINILGETYNGKLLVTERTFPSKMEYYLKVK